MSERERPVVAITMGDAAGIGPEIVIKALLCERVRGVSRPVVVGDSRILLGAARLLNAPVALHRVDQVNGVHGRAGEIDVFDLSNLDPGKVNVGQVCADCGRAAMEYVAKGAEMAMKGEVRALVTAPLNKEAAKLAGYEELGHLDYLARLSGVTEHATMLVSGQLRVVHLTTHYSLRKACDLVGRERVLAKLKLTQDCFQNWGVARPRIGVAALNPHGGEGGLLGSEEEAEIAPAVRDARGMGMDARGPFPADSVFNRAIDGEFDAVLAMYHDQGHIPVKVHGVEESVSIALGLPFVRTSVDHGTAFDIAGKGVASSRSMEEAIVVAAGLARTGRLPGI